MPLPTDRKPGIWHFNLAAMKVKALVEIGFFPSQTHILRKTLHLPKSDKILKSRKKTQDQLLAGKDDDND